MITILASFLSIFSAEPERLALQGYVEGDYVRIGSPIPGTLTQIKVREGEMVTSGTPLFLLDTLGERAARNQAAAQLAQAEALLANMRKGRRPDEIKAIAARKAQAEASERLSAATLRRQETLMNPGFASHQVVDQARATLERDRALVAQSSSELRVATLGARDDEILAQEALVALSRAELVRADKKLADMAPTAPSAALVQKLFYQPGEFVAAGQPVASLLPPENVKIVFFVPEPKLGLFSPGQEIAFACSGCAPDAKARISHISTQAEYAPPILYSIGNRDKLVFRVEARPQAAHAVTLHPGQPADVIVTAR